MRNQSIFQSTKSIATTTARGANTLISTAEEALLYAKDEVVFARSENKLENVLEAKMNRLQRISEESKFSEELLLEVADQYQRATEYNGPEAIKNKLLSIAEATMDKLLADS